LSFVVAAVNFGVPPASQNARASLCVRHRLGCQSVFLMFLFHLHLSAFTELLFQTGSISLHSCALTILDCCCLLLTICCSHGERYRRDSFLLSWSSLSPRQIPHTWVLWWSFLSDPVSPPCGSQILPCPFSKFYVGDFPTPLPAVRDF